jgi:hypothetical protein
MGNITAVEIYNKASNLDIIITNNQNKLEIPIYTFLRIICYKGDKK